jgi:hypothetical protein
MISRASFSKAASAGVGRSESISSRIESGGHPPGKEDKSDKHARDSASRIVTGLIPDSVEPQQPAANPTVA